MSAAQYSGFSEKQSELIDFIYQFMERTGCAPDRFDMSKSLGGHEANYSSKMTALEIKGVLHFERAEGKGSGKKMIGIKHPMHGWRVADTVMYDQNFGVWRFADDVLPVGASVRKCLSCEKDFVSSGINNRMCRGCKELHGVQNAPMESAEYISNVQALMTGTMGGFSKRKSA